MLGDCLSEMSSVSENDYLDLSFMRNSDNNLSTKFNDRQDDFPSTSVNFSVLTSNIFVNPDYGIFSSHVQLIQVCHCHFHQYIDFTTQH